MSYRSLDSSKMILGKRFVPNIVPKTMPIPEARLA